MVEVIQELKKIGGSLMVRIPKDTVKKLELKEGDTVYFEPKKEKADCFGLFPGLAPYEKPAPEEFSKYA